MRTSIFPGSRFRLFKRKQVFLSELIVKQPDRIRQRPSDRNGPPDPAHSECGYGGQQICQRDARAQRNDRENHAHPRFSQRTVQSVKQEQAAYAAVKCAFNAQIAHAFRNHLGFFAIYEKHHQRFCESADEHGQNCAEDHGNAHRADQSRANPVALLRPVVLRNECGKSVAEILHRHIGESVDFHCGGKGSHHDRTEAVDKSLHHQNSEVHNRLLYAGQGGEGNDSAHSFFPQATDSADRAHLRKARECVNGDADAGKILGDHGCLRRTGNASPQSDDEPKVKHDVQYGRTCQKNQRRDGISDCPKEGGEIIVQENGGNSDENHAQVRPHIPPDLVGDSEKSAESVQTDEGENVQEYRNECNEEEGGAQIFAQRLFVALSEAHGKQRAASHAQSENDRRQKCHQRKGRPYSRKGVPPEKMPDNQRIGNIIALL